MYKLNVPFTEKEEAKSYGARWNGQGKFWFCNELNDNLRRWYKEENTEANRPVAAAESGTPGTDPAPVADGPFSAYKTVSEVNEEISNQFDRTSLFQSILVKGEVTNFRGANNGNYYFDIKDDQALLSCAIWKSNAERILRFELESGKAVAIKGNLKFYDKRGTSTLHVSEIADIGDGQASLQYLQLKKKLEEEGLFSPEHKKPIPKFPTRVGIVTSKSGQAIQDIQKIAQKRDPFVQLILFHVNVQGQNAVPTIINGIKTLDQIGLDTIIVGRGGGTDEELKAYNDENLARTVFAARTPIISAVGHQGNWALIDLVSDCRVATPSEAAEEAIPDVMTTLHRVAQLKKGIRDNMRNNLLERIMRLQTQKARLEGKDPARVLKEKKDRLQVISDGMRKNIQIIYDTTKNRYQVIVTRLNGLSPTAKLVHGFGYITRGDEPIMSVKDVKAGDELSVRIHDGRIKTTVNEVTEN